MREKWANNHKEWLIIDSSQVKDKDVNNPWQSVYNSTLLYTEAVQRWKGLISDELTKNFIVENKIIAHGEQAIWRHTSGEKFLTFSYYTRRGKIMTFGSHEDLKSMVWNI